MMFETVLPHRTEELLIYLPKYGVLICKICQFAVQPNALSGHLLKHQIYRTERKRLLDKISTLALQQPEDILSPPFNSEAIPDLPVYEGYRCNVSGCTHTCVSQKRMSHHWSEFHRECSSQNIDCRPTHLQSFFKGNKIRYFEVKQPLDRAVSHSDSSGSVIRRCVFSTTLFTDDISCQGDNTMDLNSPNYVSEKPLSHLDMKTLKLLHYYTTSTSHTVSRGVESASFWAQDILALAFDHEFLMFGILGVAACHSSSLPCETTTALEYQQIALQYQSSGIPGFRAAMADPTTENITAIIAFAWLLGIQRCAGTPQWKDNHAPAAAALDNPMSPIIEFLMLMRGGCEMVLKFQHLLPTNSSFLLLGEVVEELMSPHDDSSSLDSFAVSSYWLQYPGIPLAACHQLLNLPQLLKEALPAIPSEEMTIVIPAISCLTKSYARSYASNNGLALWNGIEAWVLQLSDKFLNLLEAGHPAALVVFAHWCVLTRRTESHYWFMNGQSARLFGTVERLLEGNASSLISDLSV